jgi:hypothetical protein
VAFWLKSGEGTANSGALGSQAVAEEYEGGHWWLRLEGKSRGEKSMMMGHAVISCAKRRGEN